MVNSNCTSPAHYSLAGNFSPEDMQELLGAMGDEQPLSRPLKTESNSLEGSLEEPGSEVGSNLLQVGEDFKDDGDGLNDIPEDGKVQARSERKKNREKQRRSDVNRQFADLTHMLRQIEAEEAEDENSKARLAFNAANRVDLITRTISQLERLRESSKRRKLEVSSLELQLEQAKQAGEDTAAKLKETMFNQPTGKQQMMMMVPMMMPSPDSSMGGHGHAAMLNHPYMAQQGFMQMPQPYHQAQAPQQQQQQHAAQGPAMQHASQAMFPMSFPQNAAMQQPQGQMMPYMMPQQMQQAFPQMMAAPAVPPPVSSAMAPSQLQSFQPIQPAPSNNGPADSSTINASGRGGKGQQSSMSGGNLAHCA